MPGSARRRPALVLALSLSTLGSPGPLGAQDAARADSTAPPVAARVTHIDTVAGVVWPDPYAWIRDDQRERPEVLAYLKAENDYTAAMSRGHGYSRVGVRQVSPDGNLLAYTHDTTGSEWYTVYVKDLRTGKILPDKIDSVSYGLEWAADNRTLFFTRDNAAHRPDRILRRALGDRTVTQVVSEPDSLFFLGLSKTKDRTYLLAESRSYTTGEVRYLPAGKPAAEWQVLLPRREGVEYSAEHHGDDFLVLTNDGAVNFKVMRVPADQPDPSHWTELVPASDSALIEGMDVFQGHLVLYRRGDARQQIRVFPFAGDSVRAPYDVDFPEVVHGYDVARNPEFNTRALRFTYSSPRTPPTVYDYDLVTRKRMVRKVTEVPNFDPRNYVTERVWAPASDGVKVPISLLYRRTLRKGIPHPMLLYSYGSYGASSGPDFNVRVLMLKKKNTFTDFIAAAEYLEQSGWTSAPTSSGSCSPMSPSWT